jgi:carotenoid cleavage dioxygenase
MMAIPDQAGYDNPMAQSGAILKYDRVTGARTSIELGLGQIPGEPVFAPAEGGGAEDDGYLMTFVYDASTDTSRFMVFDAATMDDEPVGAVDLPRIPFGFHGSWIPSSVAG